eukprot:GHVR01054395.1.p1 GENE.GHVR01054395.1~~GHVR01054395.1.p1  ORF type:complete len:162 (-),score=15.02 GHVR01054395.1:22-507(-)
MIQLQVARELLRDAKRLLGGGCVVTALGATSIKYDTDAYFTYGDASCSTVVSANTIAYPATDVDCKKLANVDFAVKQETTPTNLCYYDTGGCADDKLVNCASSNATCVKFGASNYVKIVDLKAQAFSDPGCATNTTIATAVSASIVRVGNCIQAGKQAIHA